MYGCFLGAGPRVDVGHVFVTAEVHREVSVNGREDLWFHVDAGWWFGVPERVLVSGTGSVPLLVFAFPVGGCAADRGCEVGMPGVGEPDFMGACDLSTELVPRGACVEVRVKGASVGSDHSFVVGLDKGKDAFRDV